MFTWKYSAGGRCELLESRQLLTVTPAWLQADIGAFSTPGSATVALSSLTISGSGTGLGAGNDAGHFSYIALTGDGEIDAQVAAINSVGGTGMVGLVIRSNLTSYSPEAAVDLTSTGSVQYENRLTSGAWANSTTPYSPVAVPIWLRLVRLGQQISAYESTDGSSWITEGSDTLNLGTAVYIGAFVGGGAASASATVTLQNIYVGAVNQPFTTSWVGNTFGGGDQYVQGEIDAMYVMPDGTVYTDSNWDESGHEAGIYRNGQMIGALQDTHGWSRLGGTAITSDGTYIYLGMQQGALAGQGSTYPSAGNGWYAVRRYHLDGSLAPFSGGSGWDSDMLIISVTGPVTGLAVTNGTLLVSDSEDGVVLAYNASTMTQTARWSLENAGAITTDSQGTAWIIQSAGGDVLSPRVVHFGVDGSLLPGEIDGLGDPIAMAMNTTGQLLVTDDGPAKQVFTYSLSATPQLVSAFGNYGGLSSGTPGAVTPTKFDGLAGVGMDAAGNLYVNTSAHGATLRSFSPTGAQNWELDGLEFVDIADADPASDGTAVYTQYHQYTIDYSQPAGQQWTLSATTIDPVAYPQDPRLLDVNGALGLTSVMMRRINGSLFMFVDDSLSRYLVIYRFVGDIAVPAAMFARGPAPVIPNSPTSGAWVWVDRNDDGSFQANEFQSVGAEDDNRSGVSVDANGNIWFASSSNGISEYRVNGLDAAGVPQYNALNQSAWPAPAPITELARVLYDASTDTLYIAGYTSDAPHTGPEWGTAGTVVFRYNNWSTIPSLQWRINLPYAPTASPPIFVKSLSIAGDRLFAGITHTAQIYQYDTNTGVQLGTLYPGPEVAGQSGWFDTSNSINAIQRANGEIVVFAEEVTQSKVLMYELNEPAVTGLAATLTGSTASLSWALVAGAVGYDIQRSQDGVNFATLATVAGAAATFSDPGLSAGVTYYYRIRVRGNFGESAYSAAITPVVTTAKVAVVVLVSPVVAGSAKSGTTKPVTTKPVATKPITTKPTVAKPVVTKPVKAWPIKAPPRAGRPSVLIT